MNAVKTQMDEYFHISDTSFCDGNDKHKVSLWVNEQMMAAPKNLLLEWFKKFKLSPVWEYLAINTLGQRNYVDDVTEYSQNIYGFARYIDTYLIEMSAGNRTKLEELSIQITGKPTTAFSKRLIRLEIISELLSQIRDSQTK